MVCDSVLLQDEMDDSALEALSQRVTDLEESLGQRMDSLEEDVKSFREVFEAYKDDVRDHLENLTSQTQSSSVQTVITPQEGCVLIKGMYYDQIPVNDLVRVLQDHEVSAKRYVNFFVKENFVLKILLEFGEIGRTHVPSFWVRLSLRRLFQRSKPLKL